MYGKENIVEEYKEIDGPARACEPRTGGGSQQREGRESLRHGRDGLALVRRKYADGMNPRRRVVYSLAASLRPVRPAGPAGPCSRRWDVGGSSQRVLKVRLLGD